MVPLPVIVASTLGLELAGDFGGGAAYTTVVVSLLAVRFGGTGALSCCNSFTFILSADNANCTCGAAKLCTVIWPPAFVWPMDAARFCTTMEFCVKRRSAFLICSGLVNSGVLMAAFCRRPLPS